MLYAIPKTQCMHDFNYRYKAKYNFDFTVKRIPMRSNGKMRGREPRTERKFFMVLKFYWVLIAHSGLLICLHNEYFAVN